VRLFVAVRPPVDVLAHLARTLARPPAPTWHLTLAFLGEVDDDAPLAGPLADVAARRPPFSLALAGSGRFGPAVWVGVTGDVPALAGLAADVAAACGLGDDRPYRPHLTVARGRLDPAALASYAGPSWTVDRLVLVRSVLGRRAEHTVRQEHRLLG
jgi:2'-5' RNA ligase